MMNLVLSPDGKLSLYILGAANFLTGAEHVAETQRR
jgi:hypothetical protein